MSSNRPYNTQSHLQSLSFNCLETGVSNNGDKKSNEIYLATKAKLEMLESKKVINSYRRNEK